MLARASLRVVNNTSSHHFYLSRARVQFLQRKPAIGNQDGETTLPPPHPHRTKGRQSTSNLSASPPVAKFGTSTLGFMETPAQRHHIRPRRHWSVDIDSRVHSKRAALHVRRPASSILKTLAGIGLTCSNRMMLIRSFKSNEFESIAAEADWRSIAQASENRRQRMEGIELEKRDGYEPLEKFDWGKLAVNIPLWISEVKFGG